MELGFLKLVFQKAANFYRDFFKKNKKSVKLFILFIII